MSILPAFSFQEVRPFLWHSITWNARKVVDDVHARALLLTQVRIDSIVVLRGQEAIDVRIVCQKQVPGCTTFLWSGMMQVLGSATYIATNDVQVADCVTCERSHERVNNPSSWG